MPAPSSGQKMKAECFFKTLVTICQTACIAITSKKTTVLKFTAMRTANPK
jgi:hypothetical protein